MNDINIIKQDNNNNNVSIKDDIGEKQTNKFNIIKRTKPQNTSMLCLVVFLFNKY